MDVCAFVGVAPRGPARVPIFNAAWAPPPWPPGATVTPSIPVAVESWDAYRRLFGEFSGPGLLPYAVAAFFENGGRRAYIVRIAHRYVRPDGSPDEDENAKGVAAGRLMGVAAGSMPAKEVWLRARNEGAWGNQLRATLSFRTRPLAIASESFDQHGLTFPLGTAPVGTVLRLDIGGGNWLLAQIATIRDQWHPDTGEREGRAEFAAPVLVPIERAEIVTGELSVDDNDGRTELHQDLGLTPLHPRWLAAVLVNESELLYPAENPKLRGNPDGTWTDDDLVIDPQLAACRTAPFGIDPDTGDRLDFAIGANRYRDIVPDDFFDPQWVAGDERPGCGVHALAELDDLSLVVVPDLYSPRPLDPIEPVIDASGAGGEFDACMPAVEQEQAQPPEDLDGLRRDPSADLEEIIGLQRRLVDFATGLESFVVLLDVPPGLSQPRVIRWRMRCASAYAAAYYPWLLVPQVGDGRDDLVRINPSAAAAGIIARREVELGVQGGPANALASNAVDVTEHVTSAQHDELHRNAINVYLRERDGVRLTAARTLSLDRAYRQLSVRRLITMLRRILFRQMQWVTFEPNNAQLRANVRLRVESCLRALFRANAFAGATEREAFFVRCDDELNPPATMDAGRLLALVGVAPVEPVEFIVLQIARMGDGTLRVGG
jgi:hypothetical protein